LGRKAKQKDSFKKKGGGVYQNGTL